MWLKKIASKSIALALAGAFAVTPLFNMVSAMEGVVDYKNYKYIYRKRRYLNFYG